MRFTGTFLAAPCYVSSNSENAFCECKGRPRSAAPTTPETRLALGEKIRLHANVRAGKHAGSYDVATATIPGGDPNLRDEEIAFSCHLDHQRPGANDNASGSVAILEVARAINRLINEGKLAPPARTLRFIWPPEIEGTIALLNAKPELASDADAFLNNVEKLAGGVTQAVTPHGDGRLVFRRNAKLKGPMSAFGYDYFSDHYGEERESKLLLPQYRGVRGSGGEYAYEVLNLVNGRRTAQEIRDVVSATYGQYRWSSLSSTCARWSRSA